MEVLPTLRAKWESVLMPETVGSLLIFSLPLSCSPNPMTCPAHSSFPDSQGESGGGEGRDCLGSLPHPDSMEEQSIYNLLNVRLLSLHLSVSVCFLRAD